MFNQYKVVGDYGKYELKFPNGRLNGEVFYNIQIFDDFIVVQSFMDGPWHIVNFDGTVGETYHKISRCIDGFSVVIKKPGDENKYRDIIGRITDVKTESGAALYQYLKNPRINYFNLNKDFYSDRRFKQAVIQEEMRRAVYPFDIEEVDDKKKSELQLSVYEDINDWLHSNIDTQDGGVSFS